MFNNYQYKLWNTIIFLIKLNLIYGTEPSFNLLVSKRTKYCRHNHIAFDFNRDGESIAPYTQNHSISSNISESQNSRISLKEIQLLCSVLESINFINQIFIKNIYDYKSHIFNAEFNSDMIFYIFKLALLLNHVAQYLILTLLSNFHIINLHFLLI